MASSWQWLLSGSVPEVFGPKDASDRGAQWQTTLVVALVVVAVLLAALALTRDPRPAANGFEGSSVSDTEGAEPSAGSSTGDESDGPDGTASPSGSAAGEAPPRVKDQRRADFTLSDQLPNGARIYDNESVSSGLVVRDGALQHGRPRGPVAVSSLETQLTGDVSKLGARVRFVGDDSGSVVLVAWQSSFVDSRRNGQAIPATGLRLVAAPGSWELTAGPGAEVIGSGSFAHVQGTETFEVYRRDAEAWVVDPAGAVTHIDDERIGSLAGSWACWQLVEDEVSQNPAVIEALWAG